MKNMLNVPAIVLFSSFAPTEADTQSERNKIVLTVSHNGNTVTTDLGSVNYGISRYADYGTTNTVQPSESDTDKQTALPQYKNNFYMSLTVKNVSTDLLQLMANKDICFNGTIIITDTHGKNPVHEIRFTNGFIESYSDQYTSYVYEDNFATAGISINCSSLVINGVTIE